MFSAALRPRSPVDPKRGTDHATTVGVKKLLAIRNVNLYSRARAGSPMMKKWSILFGILVLSCIPVLAATSGGQSTATPDTSSSASYVYVAPNVLQIGANQVFSSFTLTNTTPYWFNPQVYLVNLDGEVVRHFSPLLKGFGTWQEASTSLLKEDFQGSIWIVSAQPIAASSFIYQYDSKAGALALLGNDKLEQISPEAANNALQLLLNR